MIRTRRLALATLTVALLVVAASCREEPAEQIYDMKGTIVSRDTANNLLTVNHEKVDDFMGAMTMPYPVRGADVSTLPPDGAKIIAKLHSGGGEYWLTDVHTEK